MGDCASKAPLPPPRSLPPVQDELTKREKLELEWRHQRIPEVHFPAMHGHVDVCVAEAQALATRFGVCLQLRMFNETLVDARPAGPFTILWETTDNQKEVGEVRARLGAAADGRFASVKDVQGFGLSVLDNHSVAIASGHWGPSTWYTVVGFLMPVASAPPAT